MLMLRRLDAARHFVAGAVAALISLIVGGVGFTVAMRSPNGDIWAALVPAAVLGCVALLNFLMAYVKLKATLPATSTASDPMAANAATPSPDMHQGSGFDAEAAIARYLAEKANEAPEVATAVQLSPASPAVTATARPAFGRKIA